jgi:hypothetical protein
LNEADNDLPATTVDELRVIVWSVALAALVLLTAPALAETSAGDPCSAAGGETSFIPGHIRVDQDASLYIAKYAQRACRLINSLADDISNRDKSQIVSALRAVNAKLRDTVLEPIYRQHPDLRGQDLTAAQTYNPKIPEDIGTPVAASMRHMGPATATYLRWVLADTLTGFRKASAEICTAKAEAEAEKCAQGIGDVFAELGYAATPIYSSYPDLWRLNLKEVDTNFPPRRSSESDAAYRKAAPAPGSVRLTPGAASTLRAMLASERRDIGKGCRVASILWSLSSSWKEPTDTEWKKTGPQFIIGTYRCSEVPPDTVRVIDGIPIIFAGEDASQFAGKLIDIEKNGKVVVKDQ